MNEEMREGWGVCTSCRKEYYATKIKYPFKDSGHPVSCPSCGSAVGWVSKGTDDFRLQAKEQIIKQQKEEDSKPRCPNCNKTMVKRKGYSEFWGCQDFPRCKGTSEINFEQDDEEEDTYY
ncbi:MAG TPA: hypothetical protein GX707_15930 [Epulopiscium sp.]|nr:hypothetical protein [Candidatus Epulonipiscium sp.]